MNKKKTRKKVGLVTWLGNGNYGTSLQSYSLYRVIESLGYDCYYIVKFDYSKFTLKQFVKSLLVFFGFKKYKFLDSRNEKLKRINKFQEKFIKQIEINTKQQYKKLLKDIKVYIAGSDQIWNSYFELSTFMLLDFAGENKRVSYASSIGAEDIPEKNKGIFYEHLVKFSHISLREEVGVKVIRKLLNRDDIIKVLDPTFLLTESEWKSVSQNANFKNEIPSNYMLCYLIGKNEKYEEQIRDILEKIQISNLIIIPSEENKFFEISNSLIYEDAGIEEFVKLIDNASLICTDSFHATAISINLSKDFIEFIRHDNKNPESQNSRLYDLLNHFDLNDCIYNKDSDFGLNKVNYSKIQSLLSESRIESIKYLVDAIEF